MEVPVFFYNFYGAICPSLPEGAKTRDRTIGFMEEPFVSRSVTPVGPARFGVDTPRKSQERSLGAWGHVDPRCINLSYY